MSDGANTPQATEQDLSLLGPATQIAVRAGVKACNDALGIYDALTKSRKLDARELRDRAEWQDARTTLLTQPYPLPYKLGRERGANDSGSHSGKDDPA